MNVRTNTLACSALMLVVCCGSAGALHANVIATEPRDAAVTAGLVDMRSASWLMDRKVVNNNGEEIGAVSDLILNRGSARIEYLVVKTGAILGMGGRSTIIPYASFTWEQGGKDRFMLAMTPAPLKAYPEFTGESWVSMKDQKDSDKNALRQRLEMDSASPSDPYVANLDAAKTQRVEGTVTKVERLDTSTFGQQIVITVMTDDHSTRKVALGPSWYVNATAAAPMRGDKVRVDTLVLPRDPDQMLVGTDYRSGERRLALRDTSGTPAWALKSVESNGRAYSTSYSRYLRASDLSGMKIDCRGIDAGKVNAIIIDRHSGEVGFVSVDPNENFLGIGDTKRLVPWAVATVTVDGIMRIDASKEMVLASPETPSDLSTLNNGTHIERSYKAFDVPMPRFEASPHMAAVTTEGSMAWTGRGEVMSSMERNSAKLLDATVTDITEVKFEKGIGTARAAKLKLANDGSEELVILGPAAYIDTQAPVFRAGDVVKVEVCRTTIDGRTYWLTRSVDVNGKRTVYVDGNNSPAWAQR